LQILNGDAELEKESCSKKNNIKKESKFSIGQINVPPTPKESFIISKKYGEDYDFFDSSLELPDGDPFTIEDSNIVKNQEEKNNVEVSSNNISNTSDLFFIEYPKNVLNYENNTFLLPKLNDISMQEGQNNRPIMRSSAFLESKYNLEKGQQNFDQKDQEKYKSITKTIEKHLNDPNNSLCFIKNKYISYFLEKYEEFAYKQMEPNNKDIKTLEMICESMMKDLRQFIRVFKDSVYFFYRINEICTKNKNLELYFTLDNMINFVLSLLFVDEIYSIVFEIQRKLDSPKEIAFKKSLKKIRDGKPEDFGVSDNFCLNQKTIDYFKNNNKSKFFNQEGKNNNNNKVLLEENNDDLKENLTDKIETLNHEPYAKAIDCIKNIQFLRSPSHKLKAILTSSELIMECIHDFYKKINVKFNKDIDPDDIMTIYIYMISKSTLTTLITHCNLIEKFLTESSLASISGYYFVTLNASIDFIINLKEEVQKIKKEVKCDYDEEKKEEEKRNSQITNSVSNINDQRVLVDSEDKKKQN